MVDITDEEIEAAIQRGKEELLTEPHAVAARFDVKSRRLIIDLTNGCTFAIPVDLIQFVRDLPDDQIAQVRAMSPFGSLLEWEEADIHFSVAGLVAGSFGSRKYMDTLRATQAGRATSPAKAAAARANGAKGGRPRKSA